MNPKDIATKYGASFTPPEPSDFHALASKYGATYNPPQPIQTQTQPQMPLASSSSENFGQNLMTSMKDVGTGFVKGAISGVRSVAQTLQGTGQKLIAGFSGQPLSQVEQNTGFQSLNDNSAMGQGVSQSLAPTNRGEQFGGGLETGMELAIPFSEGTAEKLIAKGKSAYEGFQAGREAKATADATGKITEMISPKATAKEAKLAQTQGRLVPSKEPTLFRAGTEGTITPSKKTLSASETIQKNIPNASEMKPTELYSAVDKNISDTATKLRPQMEATPIKPETIDKINSDWEALKKSQMAEAPATEEANVAKRQAKFESLLRKSGSGTHADLWDTAIAYDNSIPDAVKKANLYSSESLQLQKDEWLQNRQILSDAMGKSNIPEFKQMSDMYEAKNGLLSKAKVNEAQMSKINQFLKDNPKVSAALGGATIYEVAKHLGIPLP